MPYFFDRANWFFNVHGVKNQYTSPSSADFQMFNKTFQTYLNACQAV